MSSASQNPAQPPAADAVEFFSAALARVQCGDALSENAAAQMMDAIMAGVIAPELLRGYLLTLAERGETVDELVGSGRSLRRHMLPFDAGVACIDTCGTGGDGLNTFNISTAVALVVAAAGVPVAKAGNRSASGKCGSADVLEALGIPIDLSPEKARATLHHTNFVFLFAPQYHPAARHAAPVRRALGRPTIFNWIGPLCNPAQPAFQVIGVPGLKRARNIAQTLQRLGARHSLVVTGANGLDELAPDDGNHVFQIAEHEIFESIVNASDGGIERHDLAVLLGGDVRTNCEIVRRLLDGELGPARDVVVLNAGLALQLAGAVTDLRAGIARAAETIDRGDGKRLLNQLREAAPWSVD